MPHYYFHLRDGNDVIEDPEGSAFLNLQAARQEALATAREILAERVRTGQVVGGQQIDICDSKGHRLSTVPFCEAFKLWTH